MTMTRNDTPVLETDRLSLRAPDAGDRAAYDAFYAVSDLIVGKYRGRRNAAEIAGILAADIAHWQARGFGMWLLRLKDGEAVIGGAGLCHPSDWPRHELTWWLMPEHRGKGYAAEASRAAIDWAYGQGWPVVETHMRDENLPARRLAQRLGGEVIARETFPDGVARDIYALPRVAA